jgi:hypothetical protein
MEQTGKVETFDHDMFIQSYPSDIFPYARFNASTVMLSPNLPICIAPENAPPKSTLMLRSMPRFVSYRPSRHQRRNKTTMPWSIIIL